MSSAVDDDRTTRARIRDTAIDRFGRDGFGTSVRTIAADAGVSPGLVIHHFGSKDGLRRACDEHVLNQIKDIKTDALTSTGPAGLIAQLSTIERYAPLTAYVLRCLQDGGEPAVSFVDHMVSDAEQYLDAAVRAGIVKPSRHPTARARYLVMQNVGSLLIHLRLQQSRDGDSTIDTAKAIRAVAEASTLPALELYTDGLFTDRSMLDAYLAYVKDPPGDHA